MRFNIQSKLLLSHLSAVSKVVNSKNKLSILDNFLFNLEGDKLVITGSDQETTLTTNVQVQNPEGSGKFAAHVKKLLDLLKQLPDLALTFDVNDENLEINITYLHGKFNFIGVNGNEFPVKAASEEEPKHLTLPCKTVVEGIQQTIFAVGVEEMRPVMMGIFWDIKPDEIVFVASDTHKLVRYRKLNIQTGHELSFILPTKPAAILSSILEKKDGDVNITVDSKSATFETADYTLTCRFVNGRYPNYNSVIPTTNQYNVSIDRVQLLNALRRVSVFTSSSGLVKLEMRPDEVLMSTQDIDYSTSAEERIVCDYNGVEMAIGFNDENIIDVLNNIDAENISVQLIDPTRAGLFLPVEQKENEELLVLLMPMML